MVSKGDDALPLIKEVLMIYCRLNLAVLFAVLFLVSGLPARAGVGTRTAAALTGESTWGPITILDQTIAPGEKKKFKLFPSLSFESAYIDIPVFAARGAAPGPALCVTAAIHGDEINSVEVARRVFDAVSAQELGGTLVVLPVVNRHGFLMRQRYMADRQDLNRFFPGKPAGNIASVVAYHVFTKIIQRCDALIDLHTAAFYRRNLPQIRVDLNNQRALEMARNFGAGIILGKPGYRGTLRWEATQAGIPTILYEGGEPNRFQLAEIKLGVAGVLNVMAYLEMLAHPPQETGKQQVFSTSTWVRVPPGRGGNFFPDRELGARVQKNDLLGTVTDPLTSKKVEIRAPFNARIIGMSIPQVTLSGFILFDLVKTGRDVP
jgi:predicted deacylase